MSSSIELKEALSQKSETLRKELETNINNVGDNLETTTRKAIFVVGALVAAVFVIRLLSPKPKKIQITNANGSQELMQLTQPDGGVVTMIKGAIATFLLNLAKERIMRFIEEMSARQYVVAENKE